MTTPATPRPPAPSIDDDLPRRFGRYTLEEVLGAGGMGRVYRATLRGPAGFAKRVALKVLKTRDEDFLEKFFDREARIGGWLHHPNVVEIYDYGVVSSEPFLAMELVDGWPLDRFLGCHPTPPPAVLLDLALQIARGLHHAHHLEVDGTPIQLVHRDLKPGNILVSQTGGVKVVDFGLARPLQREAGEDLSAMDVLVGTPAYMSPEQPMGDEHLDQRSDIFAFGVILYELVSGQHPWPRPNPLARINALARVNRLTRTPGFWDAPNQRLPGVERVLERCLRKDPTDRFDHSRALLKALRQLQRETPPGPDLRSWLQDGPQDRSDRASVPEFTPNKPTVPAAQGDAAKPSRANATPHNLPPDRDAFIGRREDLTALMKKLKQEQRLLTLMGPGGTGKTRLSRRLGAAAMERFPGGVFFCDLSEVKSQSGIVSAVASAMAVPLGQTAPEEQVGHAIAGHDQILLLLDNFEQVVEWADVTLGRWLDMAPNARFVVTSRARLGIRGENVCDLAPLPVEDAIELFFTRAREVRPVLERTPENTPTVRKIVGQLDHLPLAVELAAARSRALSPEKLLDRLSDRFRLLQFPRGDAVARQATLRGAIQWSWHLLRPWEQLALAQASAFRGGFTLESAEAILDLEAFDTAPWPMDVVEALVDQSLLRLVEPRPGHARYRLLESIRIFAEEKLRELGHQKETQARHLAHFSEMGTDAALEALRVHGGLECFRRLALEFENLMQGVETGVALEQPDAAAHCAIAYSHSMEIRGDIPEAIRVLDQISEDFLAGQAAAKILLRRGGLNSSSAGNLADSHPDLERALLIAREHGDRMREAESLRLLGALYRRSGNIHKSGIARQHYADALAIFREQGDRRCEAVVLVEIGSHDHRAGQAELARGHLERALELFRSAGDQRGEASCLNYLGDWLRRTDTPQARKALDRSLEIAREWGSRRDEAVTLHHLGNLHCATGQHDLGQQSYKASLKIVRELGDRGTQNGLLFNLGVLSLEIGQLLRARNYFEKALHLCRDLSSQSAEGQALNGLGCVALELEEAEVALDVLARAVTIFRELGNSVQVANALSGIGVAYLQQGDLLQAETTLRQTIDLSRGTLRSDLESGCVPFIYFGDLALVLAHRGEFPAANALIDEATPPLQKDGSRHYGYLLCQQAKVQWLAGDRLASQASQHQAHVLADELHDAPNSPLRRKLETTREFCTGRA